MFLSLFLVSLSIIATKYFDCYTTNRYTQSVEMKRNRLARGWMKKYGKEKVIWGGFGFAILITAFALYLVLYVYSGKIYQILFLVIAMVISTAQFFVALGNCRQEQNWFTKLLTKKRFYA